jgi:NitT/TauT family transport system ATP-binding protein
MIAVRGLTVHFGGRVVLDGLDLDVPDDGVMAVMGPNGCGKTTLGRVLLGLLAPTAGSVRGLGGTRAAVFQEDRLCEQLDAVANVRLVLPRDAEAVEVAAELHALGLSEDSLGCPVRELSGGQRRRVTIARALLAEADLMVLDEPFTGIDVTARDRVLERVAQASAGSSVVLITHDRDDAARLGATVVDLPQAQASFDPATTSLRTSRPRA